jgi:hypothetical protein
MAKKTKKNSKKRVIKKSVIAKNQSVAKVPKISKKPWFIKKKYFLLKSIVPITWQGYIMVLVLFALNFFSVLYFKFPFGGFDSSLSFLIVLLLSIFVFLVISKKKTRGEDL